MVKSRVVEAHNALLASFAAPAVRAPMQPAAIQSVPLQDHEESLNAVKTSLDGTVTGEVETIQQECSDQLLDELETRLKKDDQILAEQRTEYDEEHLEKEQSGFAKARDSQNSDMKDPASTHEQGVQTDQQGGSSMGVQELGRAINGAGAREKRKAGEEAGEVPRAGARVGALDSTAPARAPRAPRAMATRRSRGGRRAVNAPRTVANPDLVPEAQRRPSPRDGPALARAWDSYAGQYLFEYYINHGIPVPDSDWLAFVNMSRITWAAVQGHS